VHSALCPVVACKKQNTNGSAAILQPCLLSSRHFAFPKMENVLKGHQFESLQQIQENTLQQVTHIS
jgi:hypothetical protein